MSELITVKDLKTHFFGDEGTVKAVENVSFSIQAGKTLGVVGESGCGKSVTAQSILGIVDENGKVLAGEILFRPYGPGGQVIDLAKLDPKGREFRRIRGKMISMIFQEPMTSLSPVHTIGNQIVESILLHQELDQKAARAVAAEMLERVGIKEAKKRLDDYPHSFSGGMRQRAMIAMALCCEPKLLIADEPTTALDVTIQAQILDLMRDLQDEFGMAIMMITHNLGVVANVADDVVVMYLGQVVEAAPVESLFANPSHPYTKALLRSIPRLGKKRKEQLASIEGAVPDAYNIPPGCPFHPRCSLFQPGLCDQSQPPIVKVGSGHTVRCFLASEVN
jgi:peptide/nickel transport system ATP-binding protein